MIKKLSLFIITLIIGTNYVLANTTNHIVDFNKTGTITITLKETVDKTPIEGAKINIYKIALSTSKNNNLELEYDENILNCNIDTKDLSNPNEIDKCIKNKNIWNQEKITNKSGEVIFDELELGLYLVKQTNKINGYSNIEPFLIIIPKEENNKWIYDIKANPKTDIIRLIDLTVEKKWNVSNEKIPNNIKVELLKKDELIDTITLNNENNWTYTWKQIEKSDEYSVREINIPKGYTATYRQIENKFTITNTKTLAQTGKNIIIINIFVLLGIVLITTGLILEKKNKNE